MSKITLSGNASGTGTLTVAAPNTNSDYTLTLPAETGTVTTSGSTPTFTGAVTAPSFIPNGSSVPSNGEYLPAANTLAWATSSTERTRIISTGRQYFFNAGSATTIADCIFNFAGTFNANRGMSLNCTDSTSADMLVFATSGTSRGTVSSTSSGTTYGTTSDYRLKENVVPMTGALEKVSQLKPVTYTWKEDKSAGQGFIAHELQQIVPQCVTGTKDAVDKEGNPEYQNVDTSFLVATLTAAIQELSAKNDALEARLAALEAK